MNSTDTEFNLTTSLGFTVISSVVLNKLCSFNLLCTIPKVNFVPYTGTLSCFKTYGNAPI